MNKNDYITKEYLDNTLDKRFADFGSEIRQYMRDLSVGFIEDLGVVMDQVKLLSNKVELLDEKVDRIDGRLVRVEYSLSNLEIDLKEIKNTIPNYVEKKQFNKLEKRVGVLEENKIAKSI